jgi:SAM-dependent methyltransferase
MSDWLAFWNAPNRIYVSERHRDVHYRLIAEAMAALLSAWRADTDLPDRAPPVVLDYGCGEALHADRVAAETRKLILCEAAPSVRAALAARHAGHPRIEVRTPEEIAARPDRSVDVVFMVSVAQYLTAAEADSLFVQFRRLLKPTGRFVLADVVPPDLSPVVDALALFRLARAHGFLPAAVGGLVRTMISDYPRLRRKLGFATYDEAAIRDKLARAGFAHVARLPANIGHNQARMTFVARGEP